MRFRVELSREAQKQLARFPRDVRERLERAIDERDVRRLKREATYALELNRGLTQPV
jgi:mRNA-degrading endonuclease RelE of RelBE toxin-antitoxin system